MNGLHKTLCKAIRVDGPAAVCTALAMALGDLHYEDEGRLLAIVGRGLHGRRKGNEATGERRRPAGRSES